MQYLFNKTIETDEHANKANQNSVMMLDVLFRSEVACILRKLSSVINKSTSNKLTFLFCLIAVKVLPALPARSAPHNTQLFTKSREELWFNKATIISNRLEGLKTHDLDYCS